jgi:hypothetical protein
MEVNLNGLPNDAIHVLGLSGEDGGIVKLNAVSQCSAIPDLSGYSRWMCC